MLVKDTIAISITLWTYFSIETYYQNPTFVAIGSWNRMWQVTTQL